MLDLLRQEIDSIDDDIHQLLIKRTELAKKIADAKGGVDGLAIRPSREANIHRRLKQNHRGNFPFVSLARMWREMINAFTLLQADYTICVYAPQGDMRCWEIARDQFGSLVKMIAFDNYQDAVLSAEKSKLRQSPLFPSKPCNI